MRFFYKNVIVKLVFRLPEREVFMAGGVMGIAFFVSIIGGVIYLLLAFLISEELAKSKRRQLLYFALFISFPLLIGTLNYYGFCFKKMRFLNEQDIYAILDNSKYKKQSNECYGVYIFSTEKIYGCFEKHPENGYQYDTGDKFFNFLSKTLGFAYARIQVREENKEGYKKGYRHFLLMDNCGNFYDSDF